VTIRIMGDMWEINLYGFDKNLKFYIRIGGDAKVNESNIM